MGFIFTLTGIAGATNTIPANDPNMEYTGRIDFSDSLAPKFSYSGVSIRACFSGTSVAAILNDDTGSNYYNILLDGKLIDTLKVDVGQKTYQLASGLSNTTHEIELFKRTELTFGKTQFMGFVVDDDASLVPITNQRNILIEFIGNSITCGYGNEGTLGEVFGATTENHYMSYAALTARNFNARHIAVCRSGIGIYRNYDGPSTGSTDCMSNYYTRTFLYDENPKYDFKERPDLVCINLGTNDFSTTGGDSARYVSNYLRLIDTIQTKYAMPDIVCLIGPMLSGSTLINIRKYTKCIAETATAKGKGNVTYFEMSAQGELGYAIDYHPTIAQHKKSTQELTAYIHSLKGWKITPSLSSASIVTAKQLKITFTTPIQDPTNHFAGFNLYENGKLLPFTASSDSSDKRILYLFPQQSLSIGGAISLGYTPGTVESSDSIRLGVIEPFDIQNTLTETKLSKGTINTNGNTVTLTFNKKMKDVGSIDGLTITDSEGTATIDSFQLFNNMITIYVKDNFLKGDSVFVSYNGNSILGADEIALESFSNTVIKNNSKYTSATELKNVTFNIFPNPNPSGRFQYSLGNMEIDRNTKLEVFNACGAIIYNQPVKETKGSIDLMLSKGIYIFKVTAGKNILTQSVEIN